MGVKSYTCCDTPSAAPATPVGLIGFCDICREHIVESDHLHYPVIFLNFQIIFQAWRGQTCVLLNTEGGRVFIKSSVSFLHMWLQRFVNLYNIYYKIEPVSRWRRYMMNLFPFPSSMKKKTAIQFVITYLENWTRVALHQSHINLCITASSRARQTRFYQIH